MLRDVVNRYLELERLSVRVDGDWADHIRDLMDRVWNMLQQHERDWLRKRDDITKV